MNEREQKVVNHINDALNRAIEQEFFIKGDAEINIKEVAQELVNNGFTIEEYSFGQFEVNGQKLSGMHRIVVGGGTFETRPRPRPRAGGMGDLKDVFGDIFGL